MTITTKTEIDEITVTTNGIILVRQNTTLLDGTNVIGNNYQRSSLVPGQDLTDQDPKVVAIANAIWTPDVIDAYKTQIANPPTLV